MADDLRQRYANAVLSALDEWAHNPGDEGQFVGRMVHAVMAVRDEELEQLRYERRLLGAARMVLDLVAAGDSSRWDQARQGAEDVAQRIVDEIGHPVTDEPALGPNYRVQIREWRERAEKAERRLAEFRRYIDEDFRFWCSPHGVAGRYARNLIDYLDRLDGQEGARG